MNLKKTSKYLSYLLRHNPAALNLNMDRQGWVDVQAMRVEQHVFYLSENGVWLADRVPAGYLSLA